MDGAIHREYPPRRSRAAKRAATRGAGCELYEACLKVPEVRPGVRCPNGEARITPGFKLPAKFVIHTVGPVYRDGQHGEPEKLAACYRNSLAIAAENGCRSIAFPCISTGVYGCPIEDAAKIAVREMKEFLSPAESAEVAEGEGMCPHAPQSGRARTPAAPPMEDIFCCFSERDTVVYNSLIQ